MNHTASTFARTLRLATAAALVTLSAPPAFAQSGSREPTTGERAEGVVTQPFEDLNIKQDEVPAKLIAIEADPYAAGGMTTCEEIAKEIAELDAVLGADVDARDPTKRKTEDTMIDLGGSVISSLIPFRGVVREVTGANATKRRYQQAVYAGVTRRSFLKGLGKAKGCEPPAAPNPLPVAAAAGKD